MSNYLLAIDQGTSSSRTVVYNAQATVVASAQQEFPQIYPQPGWVEHDPEAIWESVVAVTRKAMTDAGVSAGEIAGIGITNQRETTLIWHRASGKCIHNAIVWQDRRTADYCEGLRATGVEQDVSNKTGLRLDPYFSASKIRWILDNVANAVFVFWIPARPLNEKELAEQEKHEIMHENWRVSKILPWLCLAAVCFTYINIGGYYTYIELAAFADGISQDWTGPVLTWSSFFDPRVLTPSPSF